MYNFSDLQFQIIKRNKRYLWYIIMPAIFYAMYLISSDKDLKKGLEKEYKILFKASINGKIVKLQKEKVSISFSVDNGPPIVYFMFPDNSTYLNGSPILSSVVELGDSISKKSETNIIFLYKKGFYYKYKFKQI